MGSRIDLKPGQGHTFQGTPRMTLAQGADFQARILTEMGKLLQEIRQDLRTVEHALVERQNQLEQTVAGQVAGLQQDLANVMVRYFALIRALQPTIPDLADRIDAALAEWEAAAQALAQKEQEATHAQ